MLTTLAKLRLSLGQSTDPASDDPQMLMLLEAAETAVKRYLGRDLEQQTYTEYYDGTGRPRLLLNQRPVTAITGVWLDNAGYYGQRAGAFDAATTALTQGTDFIVRPPLEQSEKNAGILEMITPIWFQVDGRSCWPTGQGNVKVTYTAGYNPIPLDLQVAVHQTVAQALKMAENGAPLQEETFGEYSYTLLSGEKDTSLASARALLNRYREACL